MQNFETMEDACRVAREVVAGTMEPSLGCGLIGGIGEKLNHHPALMEFIHIAHLLEGSGHEGFTRSRCYRTSWSPAASLRRCRPNNSFKPNPLRGSA